MKTSETARHVTISGGADTIYYRRHLPIMSGVYRPLETRRFVVTAMGGYWPVVQRLPNGHLGVVTRDGDFHVGQRGRLVILTSPDGGESWSHSTVISGEGSDNRNPAFGVAADGTLLVSFIKQVNYTAGHYDRQRGLPTPGHYKDRQKGLPTPLYISRSEDNGATWSPGELAKVDGRESWPVSSPFGKMVTLEDGTVLMSYYLSATAFLIRSHDGGRAWVDRVALAKGFGETALCHLGGQRFVAMLRSATEGDRGLWQTDSEDGGYTWTEPRRITPDMEHPGDVIRLRDGRLLLTYGRRVTPYGIQGMISRDDGRTWDADNKVLLVADSGDFDQGYPSSIQRDDGAIVTVYYSTELHVSRRPRPLRGCGWRRR